MRCGGMKLLPALALALALALVAPCRADWVYSPDSYMHMQVENCQTQQFEKGPCAACPSTDPACATLDADAYTIPTAYGVVTTVLEEACARTDAGADAGVDEATCTSVSLVSADNDADKTECEAAGDPPSIDNYCGYTYPGPVQTPRSLRPVHLVRNENYTVSWHIRGDAFAASGASTATRRSFMFMSRPVDGFPHPCPTTLAGRQSFLQDLCEQHGDQSSCAAAGAPCSWNDGESLCEVVVQSQQGCTGTASDAALYPDCDVAFVSSGRTSCPAGCTLVEIPSYTGTVTFAAPDQVGTHSLDLYDEVDCPEPPLERTCPEVADEKPDIIRFSASLVGIASDEEIRRAIAIIAQEEIDAVVDLVVGPSAQGESFSVDADVHMSGSNATIHEQRLADFEKNNFAATLTSVAGHSFHPDQTLTSAFTAKGEAPCWRKMHSIEFVVETAQCEVPCAHGTCVLTDTCECEPGWGHTILGLDCARPLCPDVFAPGCSFGCCNGGNCTAPATCSCRQGWGGTDCRDYVCEPHWDQAKMAQFTENGGEGSSCENGGVCVGYNTCQCSAAWEGDGCQINVDECVQTHLQSPTCSTDSMCVDSPGYYNCTCFPHFVGDGAYCYPERNATVKVFAPGVSGYALRQGVIADVTTALATPLESIEINSVDESPSAAWLELRVMMVVDRPPAMLCEELLALLVNASEAAGGDGAAAVLVPTSEGGYGLAFDVTYGVEVSEWVAPPPLPTRTFALELTLTADWDEAYEDPQSTERVVFETSFKASVAAELDVDTSRVNITGLSEGSIRVSFEILPDPSDTGSGSAVLSVAAAVTAFETTMAACIDGPAICPTFGGFEPAEYRATETTPPPPPVVDEDALLRPQEISCYSATDARCEQVACSNDAECQALEGVLHGGAHAYCINSICEDGLTPKDNSGGFRPRPVFACTSLYLLLQSLLS
jgi:hypothetical protein